jgi:methionyl-tRNA formyltransferase
MSLRLIFMGTPEFAVPTLRSLHEAGHEIVAVYTREPKPGGRRGLELQPTPIEQEARRFGIPVLTPKTLKTPEALDEFRAFHADAAVVVAYGMILPQAILDVPRFGCFNLHASLLPRWRGAAPIERAIMEDDAETGVAVMKMDAGLDTGEVALEEPFNIEDGMTGVDLRIALADVGARLMVLAMEYLERHHQLPSRKQREIGESYATKIEKAETRINWRWPARRVLRHIHALSPDAWCEVPIRGQLVRMKILRCKLANGSGRPGELLDDRMTIACGHDAIRVVELQKAGGSPMSVESFQSGARLGPPLVLY